MPGSWNNFKVVWDQLENFHFQFLFFIGHLQFGLLQHFVFLRSTIFLNIQPAVYWWRINSSPPSALGNKMQHCPRAIHEGCMYSFGFIILIFFSFSSLFSLLLFWLSFWLSIPRARDNCLTYCLKSVFILWS